MEAYLWVLKMDTKAEIFAYKACGSKFLLICKGMLMFYFSEEKKSE